MHVACFLYLMKVIKHGGPFLQSSYFFKKLQPGLLSGPETGRSCRATFWFVFSKTTHPFWNHDSNCFMCNRDHARKTSARKEGEGGQELPNLAN